MYAYLKHLNTMAEKKCNPIRKQPAKLSFLYQGRVVNKNNGFVKPYNSKKAQSSKIGSSFSKVLKFLAYFH